MGDKGRGRRKEGDSSTPVTVELIATSAAGADSRLRRALEMVLAAAARQSEESKTGTERHDGGEGDTSPSPQHCQGNAAGAELS